MQFGLAPGQDSKRLPGAIQESVLAEELGYESVWFYERHFDWVHSPSPMTMLAAVATRTSRIRLGTSILLLPLYHPVKLAEDTAVVDVISGGRLILGVASGYVDKENAGFGVPPSLRVKKLEEGVTLIRRLWTQDSVTFHGQTISVDDLTIYPKPVQEPCPPVWVGGVVPSAIRRAARLGDQLILGASGTFEDLRQRSRLFREEALAQGRHLAHSGVATVRMVFVSKNSAEVRSMKEARKSVVRDLYAGWKHSDYVSPASPEDVENRAIIADPETCISRIKELEKNGVSYLICGTHLPGFPREPFVRSMELFASSVMPYVKAPA